MLLAPANVVAGLRYALVLTGSFGGVWLSFDQANSCLDGIRFVAATSGPLIPKPETDLHFETVVTA